MAFDRAVSYVTAAPSDCGELLLSTRFRQDVTEAAAVIVQLVAKCDKSSQASSPCPAAAQLLASGNAEFASGDAAAAFMEFSRSLGVCGDAATRARLLSNRCAVLTSGGAGGVAAAFSDACAAIFADCLHTKAWYRLLQLVEAPAGRQLLACTALLQHYDLVVLVRLLQAPPPYGRRTREAATAAASALLSHVLSSQSEIPVVDPRLDVAPLSSKGSPTPVAASECPLSSLRSSCRDRGRDHVALITAATAPSAERGDTPAAETAAPQAPAVALLHCGDLLLQEAPFASVSLSEASACRPLRPSQTSAATASSVTRAGPAVVAIETLGEGRADGSLRCSYCLGELARVALPAGDATPLSVPYFIPCGGERDRASGSPSVWGCGAQWCCVACMLRSVLRGDHTAECATAQHCGRRVVRDQNAAAVGDASSPASDVPPAALYAILPAELRLALRMIRRLGDAPSSPPPLDVLAAALRSYWAVGFCAPPPGSDGPPAVGTASPTGEPDRCGAEEEPSLQPRPPSSSFAAKGMGDHHRLPLLQSAEVRAFKASAVIVSGLVACEDGMPDGDLLRLASTAALYDAADRRLRSSFWGGLANGAANAAALAGASGLPLICEGVMQHLQEFCGAPYGEQSVSAPPDYQPFCAASVVRLTRALCQIGSNSHAVRLRARARAGAHLSEPGMASPPDCDPPVGICVYAVASLMEHSCAPTAHTLFGAAPRSPQSDSEPGQHVAADVAARAPSCPPLSGPRSDVLQLVATAPLRHGDAVTISYGPTIASSPWSSQRRDQLRARFHFTCACTLCRAATLASPVEVTAAAMRRGFAGGSSADGVGNWADACVADAVQAQELHAAATTLLLQRMGDAGRRAEQAVPMLRAATALQSRAVAAATLRSRRLSLQKPIVAAAAPGAIRKLTDAATPAASEDSSHPTSVAGELWQSLRLLAALGPIIHNPPRLLQPQSLQQQQGGHHQQQQQGGHLLQQQQEYQQLQQQQGARSAAAERESLVACPSLFVEYARLAQLLRNSGNAAEAEEMLGSVAARAAALFDA